MNIIQWQELKRQLVEGPDLAKIWLYYMDHFADLPEFIELGDTTRNSYLEAVIRGLCQQMFDDRVRIANTLLVYIPEQQFYHGPVEVEGRMGGIIYAEDKKVGIFAMAADYPASDTVTYARFSKPIEVPPPPEHPELN
jgi:hypothetical protein